MRRTYLLSAFLLFCLPICAQTGTSPFEQVIGRMNHVALFQMTYPQEKVYVHFDNTGYFEDERMYFKCYVNRSDTGKPSEISRVLYVDLLSPSGYVIKQRKLRLEHGEAHGDFLLDSLYSTGFFEVRVYTRYMLNFGDDACFSRVFPIFNKPSQEGDYSQPQIDQFSYFQKMPERFFYEDSLATLDPLKQKKRKSRGYSVNVYPEGGKLVKGLYSRVAFTVVDPDHKPVQLAGEVVDSTGTTQAIVLSNAEGKGIFEIVPTSQKLTMRMTTPDNKKIEFEMPDVLDNGIVMLVDPVSDDVMAQIMSTPGMYGECMGMTVMNNGNIYLTDTLRMEKTIMRRFPRKMLRPGVNQLTLFDGKGHIHSERLFFICPKPDVADSVIVQSDDQLTPCGKVRMRLHTAPGAHLSFSAMDYGTLVDGKYGNINTYLLLGSDIAGYIPHPEYYFQADDQAHRLAADSLMLFNGWRRYDWEVMSDNVSWRNRIQPVEDQLYVYGHLKPSWNKWIKNNPVGNVDMSLYLYNEEGKYAHGETKTDSTGYYAFRLPEDVYGDWKMQIITTIKEKLKSYEVTIDRNFSPKPRFVTEAETSVIEIPDIDEDQKVDVASFERMDDERMKMMRTGQGQYGLTGAVVKAKKISWKEKKNPAWDEYDARRHSQISYNIRAIAEEYADRGEVPPTVKDWLRDNNPMFNGYADAEKGGLVLNYGDRAVVWVVNNQVWDITGYKAAYVPETQLMKLNTASWDFIFHGFIDELRSLYISIDQPAKDWGVVVYMFTEPYVSTDSKKGRRRTYFHGYDVPTKFKTDDYGVIPPVADDYRRTLWWEPNVVTDEKGDAIVEFYNNSTCTRMFVSAEGMTPEGKIVTTK